MKWNLPWKRKADDAQQQEEEFDSYTKHAGTGTLESPFVEPFRPLYDIHDDRLNETYQTRPLYTPSASGVRRSSNGSRITSNHQSYPFKQRSNGRGNFDRTPYRRDRERTPFSSRFDQEESYSIISFQWIGAILLIGLIYFGFHSSSPAADRIQTAASNAMHMDYNVSKITAWFKQHMNSGNGDAIPASAPGTGSDANGTATGAGGAAGSVVTSGSSGTAGTVTTTQAAGNGSTASNQAANQTSNFGVPLVNGTITSDYKAETQQEMILTGTAGANVQAVTDGQVAAVGNNPQQGTYVLIDHGKLGKTLYGHLGDVTVKTNDKVHAKQTIAHLDKSGKTADMYFGYIVNGKYENPHTIIKFN